MDVVIVGPQGYMNKKYQLQKCTLSFWSCREIKTLHLYSNGLRREGRKVSEIDFYRSGKVESESFYIKNKYIVRKYEPSSYPSEIIVVNLRDNVAKHISFYQKRSFHCYTQKKCLPGYYVNSGYPSYYFNLKEDGVCLGIYKHNNTQIENVNELLALAKSKKETKFILRHCV